MMNVLITTAARNNSSSYCWSCCSRIKTATTTTTITTAVTRRRRRRRTIITSTITTTTTSRRRSSRTTFEDSNKNLLDVGGIVVVGHNDRRSSWLWSRQQQQQQQHNHRQQQQYRQYSSSSTQAQQQDGTTTTTTMKEQQQEQRPIFVAATRQHVGKTTVSLAVISGLQKRFNKVGFLKPVGQQHVPVYSETRQTTISVDKDVSLVREHFHLHHIDYEHMSPVIIPSGYTKKFVDGHISLQQQICDVKRASEHVLDASDVVLCEGTGHCAVGSIVGVNNAKIASIIGADMILVANGGLGSAFDDLELNRVLCQHYNVRIAGVVINKVIPEKLEQTAHYMRKAMIQSWGVPLLGCIPDRPFLGCPALADLEKLFHTKLLSGKQHRLRHYNVSDMNIVTTSLTRFLENLRHKPSRTLYICHVTRDDLIVGFLGEYQRRREAAIAAATAIREAAAEGTISSTATAATAAAAAAAATTNTSSSSSSTNNMNMNNNMNNDNNSPLEAALIVCGRKGKYQLSQEVMDMLRGFILEGGAPVMVVPLSTSDVMSSIYQYTPKLHIDDEHRVQVAINHYEPYIDFDELLKRTTTNNNNNNNQVSNE